MNSSFLFRVKTNRRIAKNGELTNTICMTLRIIAVRSRRVCFPFSSLFSANWKRDSKKLKHATATIAIANPFGMGLGLSSLSSKAISSISTVSKRSMVICKDSRITSALYSSCSPVSEAVFTRRRNSSGVKDSINFKILGPSRFIVSRSSPTTTTAKMVAIIGIKAITTYKNHVKNILTSSACVRRQRIQ